MNKVNITNRGKFFYFVKGDFSCNSFISGITLFTYRLENHVWIYNKRLHQIVHPIMLFIKRIFNISSQISYKSQLGYGIRLPHKGNGVIISKYAEVGDNVTIYHQVTLGINESKNESERKIIIGNNCYISAGAKIISCRLGDRVKVAPNKVIYFDCESDVFVK